LSGGRPERLHIAGLRNALAGPFDLTVGKGECIAVSGPSGSGKSLFLRMIADLDPSEGEVRLDGRERGSFSAPQWRRRVVYCAAEPGWWDERVEAHFPGPALAAAGALLPRFALASGQLAGPVVRLSTGERQRLALIRGLAMDSPVLLLDEPTGALDQDTTSLVESVLRERLAAGTTIVMVTHSPDQAARLGDRRFLMSGRRLVPA
jgi:ABC-type iron transport system FetAB ATPase subunit